MTISHARLRRFSLEDSATKTALQFGDLQLRSGRSYRDLLVDDPTMVLTTGDLRVVSVSPMVASLEDERDVAAVRRLDEAVLRLVQRQASDLFGGERFTAEELRDMFLLTGPTLPLVAEAYTTYDPDKNVIANDRLAADVLFRAAVRPWTVEFNLRTMRVRVCWTLVQAMIVDEPVNTDCVLDADDDVVA